MSKRTVQRRSQLITTFGPGAMVDLPTRSVLIGGLDRWRMPTGSYQTIEEPALARLLAEWLRKQGRLEEGEAIRLLTPPIAEDDRGSPPGVDVTIFPTWFVCERVETPTIDGEQKRGRRLVRWQDLDPGGGKRRFVNDDGKKDEVTPLRFVGACPNGHLQDIDWRQLLHPGRACLEPMWLADRGTSGLLGDLEIVCRCGERLSLRDATKPGRLGMCEGRMPWISTNAHEDCDIDGRRQQLRLLSRSATNAYFAQTISVISLPKGEDALMAVVEQHWADLAAVESVEDVGQARRFNSGLRMALEGHADAAVFERLLLLRSRDEQDKPSNPRLQEFAVLAGGQEEIGVNARDARLYARTLPRRTWESDGGRDLSMIHAVVAVHRLREVMSLYGFTRLEPAPSASDGNLEEIDLAVRGAPIAEQAHWLPAIEQFGEGIFLHFDPTAIEAWERRPEVRKRTDALIDGHTIHRRKYPNLAERDFPGAAYILLHSLAHADHGDRARLRLSLELPEGTRLRFWVQGWNRGSVRHPALCRLTWGRRHPRRSGPIYETPVDHHRPCPGAAGSLFKRSRLRRSRTRQRHRRARSIGRRVPRLPLDPGDQLRAPQQLPGSQPLENNGGRGKQFILTCSRVGSSYLDVLRPPDKPPRSANARWMPGPPAAQLSGAEPLRQPASVAVPLLLE